MHKNLKESEVKGYISHQKANLYNLLKEYKLSDLTPFIKKENQELFTRYFHINEIYRSEREIHPMYVLNRQISPDMSTTYRSITENIFRYSQEEAIEDLIVRAINRYETRRGILHDFEKLSFLSIDGCYTCKNINTFALQSIERMLLSANIPSPQKYIIQTMKECLKNPSAERTIRLYRVAGYFYLYGSRAVTMNIPNSETESEAGQLWIASQNTLFNNKIFSHRTEYVKNEVCK